MLTPIVPGLPLTSYCEINLVVPLRGKGWDNQVKGYYYPTLDYTTLYYAAGTEGSKGKIIKKTQKSVAMLKIFVCYIVLYSIL